MCVACSRSSAAAFLSSSARFQLSSKHKVSAEQQLPPRTRTPQQQSTRPRASGAWVRTRARTQCWMGKTHGEGYTSHRKNHEKTRAWRETDTVVQGRLAPQFLRLFCSLECLVDLALRARLRAAGRQPQAREPGPAAHENSCRATVQGPDATRDCAHREQCRQVPELRRASSRCRATTP